MSDYLPQENWGHAVDQVIHDMGIETTKEFADKTGLTLSTAASYRRGVRRTRSLNTLTQMCTGRDRKGAKVCDGVDPDGSLGFADTLIEGWTSRPDAIRSLIYSSPDPAESMDGEGDGADADIERAYREWLLAEVGHIDFRGIARNTTVARHSILGLYTELHVATGLQNWDLGEGRVRGDVRIPLSQLVERARCVAIMGRPGAGKTTFLHFTASSYIQNAIALPLYVNVRDLYDFAQGRSHDNAEAISGDDLVDFVSKECELAGVHVPATWLTERLSEGRCALLIDGLDLLPDESARETTVECIETMAHSIWKECRFVLVSRPMAMTGRAVPVDFEVVGIDEMEWSEIEDFIRKWTNIVFQSSTTHARDKQCESLLAAIREREDLRELATNPLMLTCMTVIHFNNQAALPEGRAEVLEAVLYWLLRTGENRGPGEPKSPKFVERVLRDLALGMYQRPGQRPDRIGLGAAADLVAPRHFGGDAEAAARFLLEEESETGIVIRFGPRAGDIAFWHQAFQDYLAAAKVAEGTDQEETGWWAAVRDHLEQLEWREVILLVPACLSRLGSDRVDLFLQRLATSPSTPSFSARARRFALAGSVLAELRMPNYEMGDVPAWDALRREMSPLFSEPVTDLSLEERYFAACAYGMRGDPRLVEFEATWASLPGGTFVAGAQSTDSRRRNYCTDAAPWERPVRNATLPAFDIRKYLITAEEYREFVVDGGYSSRARELWGTLGWDWMNSSKVEGPLELEKQISLPNCPISGVSWYEAQAYAVWLTRSKGGGSEYRLPTEDEWEYAARRHNFGLRFPCGDHLTEGEKAEANWGGGGLRRKTPVGMFPASNTSDGVCDLVGNVEEWCSSSWAPDHASIHHPGGLRVVRGGSTIRFERLCRPTYRSRAFAEKRFPTIGFRLVRVKGSSG